MGTLAVKKNLKQKIATLCEMLAICSSLAMFAPRLPEQGHASPVLWTTSLFRMRFLEYENVFGLRRHERIACSLFSNQRP